MLTIGVWAIVFILLIAFADRVMPIVGGVIGFTFVCVIGIFIIGCLAFGVYWISQHQADSGEFISVLALLAFVVAGLLSVPHVFLQTINLSLSKSYEIVFPKIWGKALIVLISGGLCAYCVNLVVEYRQVLAMHRYTSTTAAILRHEKVEEAVMSLIPVLLALSIYAHRRLCKANMSTCWITRPFSKGKGVS
jgi:hypothetical protein